ncbi:hypothetical protein [Allopontixanthobacter sp.]|uniref:hypothetical protein n=1 Tax=Allopontixanthobacter sp. TaxID=2906452 RepID=UPI002AB92407|nr:hypothetical protein [Allopontixanthobacter sp.]MDZ4306836.1 hypothetical protein [Allopontixanthobacter sp.]
MSRPARRRAGQPLVVFSLLLLGWSGIRMAVWESPFPRIPPLTLVTAPSDLQPMDEPSAALATTAPQGAAMAAAWTYQINSVIAAPKPVKFAVTSAAPVPPASASSGRLEVLASHQLLWLAAMGQVPVLPDIAQIMRQSAATRAGLPPFSGRTASAVGKRWSLDSWLFLRPQASLAANTGTGFATYGASQAGAVLRYRLQPGSSLRPAAYVRATKALAAGRETEVAAGLSAVPFRGIPVAAHAELRALRSAFSTEVRPAAFAVTEIPPVPLPLGLRGETYLAAGYVGGDFATAFVDGQARVDREMLRFDRGSLRAGAGAWGGAQKGASRLDIGPSASVNVQLGPVPARVAVDYRLRAAGAAEPKSGVAITLSTGF